MFKDCSIMVITAGVNPDKVYRIEVDADTQKEVCKSFSSAIERDITPKTRVLFDGSYKPNSDEYLAISNFKLDDAIKDAIRDPLGVEAYQKTDAGYPEIKAIFVGKRIEKDDDEEFEVAFQRFRKEQYISTSFINLFFSNDTFRREKNFGLSILDSVDSYYSEDELMFASFYFARQIFDLSDYYRSATDNEVLQFTSSEKLQIENTDSFVKMANSWIRRKIAMINDSKVLINYKAAEIKELAEAAGIAISIENEKVVIPNDKEQMKIILGFLDEEAYKGPFSQETFLANSKRSLKRYGK